MLESVVHMKDEDSMDVTEKLDERTGSSLIAMKIVFCTQIQT